jgi:hypothetical protein
MQMPAFCGSCGAVFPSSAIIGGDATNVSFRDVDVICPFCGGLARIPDGTYDFVGDTIRILSAPQRTVDELTRLSAILNRGRSSRASPEAVSHEIQQEMPELTSLVGLLGLPQTRDHWYQFLTLLIMIVAFFMNASAGSETTVVDTTEVINYVYSQGKGPAVAPSPAAKPEVKAPGAKPHGVPRTGDKRTLPKHRGRKHRR